MDIGKHYTPQELEKKWYKLWFDNNKFLPDEKSDKNFTIVIPPPNITGKLHLGHALNLTLQDILIRYYRMKGYKTLWLPGEDHAGIATQHVVEQHLKQTEGKRKSDYERKDFVDKVWEWSDEYRDHIRNQLKALGASVDWSRERFTLDEGLNKAVNKVFVDLYNEGLIYKGKYIVNWCPSCGTVLADDEVEHEESNGNLWYIKYKLKNKNEYILIATTRPETMLGDVAVAINPSDERYKDLIGETVILPLINREIKIIADQYVDPNFGTGFVKITPAHDPNDYQVALRHNLERIQIMDENAKINENGGIYNCLDRYSAREKIIEDLDQLNLLDKVEKHNNSVGHCYRCNTVVEPFLMDQWFVKMKPLTKKAIEVVEKKELKFYPERWKKVYLNWMNEIRDWCISRQLWWGHRIPVWYCNDCDYINVSEYEINKCKNCNSENIRQDEDVLDTWFSSALWPFSTLGWPEKTEDLNTYYPTSVLVTGFDIIFFWVARMVIMGEKFMKEKPFSHVYITPLVRDKKGRKMSKSLGNGIDPIEVIEKYGCDPMRFTLSILAAQGKDIKLDINDIENYSKFANKIWNATRFVYLNLKDFEKLDYDIEELELEDKWIISKMNNTIKEVDDAIKSYNFNIASKELYEFFWNELCDWYIESVKGRLQGNCHNKKIAQNVLVNILDKALKLLHPIMPYLSEELWKGLPTSSVEEMLISSKIPEYSEDDNLKMEELLFEKMMNIVKGIRNVKAEVNIPNNKTVEIYIRKKSENDNIKIIHNKIKLLANIESISYVDEKPNNTATAYIDDDLDIFVLIKDIVDFEGEKDKLLKRINKLEKEIFKFEKKLSNKQFLNKAEKEIVDETIERLNTSKNNYKKLKFLFEELK